MRVVLSGLAVATLASLAALASIPALTDDGCLPSYVPALGTGCRLADGTYQIRLQDGTQLLTHGLDSRAAAGPGFGPEDEQRPPRCAADWRMHVLYGYPPDTTNLIVGLASQFREHVARMNALLNQDALESGAVEADYRVACTADGQIQVDAFAGPTVTGASPNTDFAAVVQAARAQGFDEPRTDYLIFYDAPHESVCGVGTLHLDDSLSADNANLPGTDYGVVFRDCWFSTTPMHENGHNQGAVQTLAPGSDLNGHCYEQQDIMCYPYSDLLLGVFEECVDRVRYDCLYDTYFDAAPEEGEWLASRWNIGSRLNRFISFADTPEPPPEPSPSTPTPTAGTPTSSRATTTVALSATTTSSRPPASTDRATSSAAPADAAPGHPASDAPDGARDVPGPPWGAALVGLALAMGFVRKRRAT